MSKVSGRTRRGDRVAVRLTCWGASMGIWRRLFGGIDADQDARDSHDPASLRSQERESAYTDRPASADEEVPPLELDRQGRLVDPRNGKLAANLAKWRYWEQVGIARPSIVGEQYREGLRVDDPELRVGCQLLLVAERDNSHDPNAISVQTRSGIAVGYIKKGTTPRIRKRQQESQMGIALVSRGVSEDHDHPQVRAFLIRPGRLADITVEPNSPLGSHQHQPRSSG